MTLPKPGIILPWVIAHRGDKKNYPENTKRAFDSALLKGLNGIELDLQLTKDEVPVVFHDKTLLKMGLPLKRITGISLKDLIKLSKKFNKSQQDNKILTLEEVLTIYSGKTILFLEIKIRGGFKKAYRRHTLLLKKTISLIEKKNLQNRVNLLCFYPEILNISFKNKSKINYIQNIKSNSGLEKANFFFDKMDGFCIRLDHLSSDFILKAQKKNKPVLVFTCNTPQEVTRAKNFGADGIITNDPSWLISFLQKK